jgi:hypothetical protein
MSRKQLVTASVGWASVLSPEHQSAVLIPDEGGIVRCSNSPEMIEACDRYLLTGSVEHLVGVEFELLSPNAPGA